MTNKNLLKRGKRHPKTVKSKARNLRRKGLTHREIVKKLGIGLGTAHLWTTGIILSTEQKKSIEKRRNRHMWTKKERKERSHLARTTLAPYWKKPYSKKELIDKIRNFYSENGRIPLKRELNLYREYKQHFGGWNKAIQTAGFKPNQVIFSKKFIAKDGHICDSFAEKIIDDWLLKHKIKHEKNVSYKNTKMTADFVIGNVKIEYFGLAGQNKRYDQTIHKKRKLCQEEESKLIEIYPFNLFPNRLSEVINIKELKPWLFGL